MTPPAEIPHVKERALTTRPIAVWKCKSIGRFFFCVPSNCNWQLEINIDTRISWRKWTGTTQKFDTTGWSEGEKAMGASGGWVDDLSRSQRSVEEIPQPEYKYTPVISVVECWVQPRWEVFCGVTQREMSINQHRRKEQSTTKLHPTSRLDKCVEVWRNYYKFMRPWKFSCWRARIEFQCKDKWIICTFPFHNCSLL